MGLYAAKVLYQIIGYNEVDTIFECQKYMYHRL